MEDERIEGLFTSLVSLGLGVFVPLIFGLIFVYNIYLAEEDLSDFSLRILLGLNAIIILVSMAGFIYGIYLYKHPREKKEGEEDLKLRSSFPIERAEFEEFIRKRERKK